MKALSYAMKYIRAQSENTYKLTEFKKHVKSLLKQ